MIDSYVLPGLQVAKRLGRRVEFEGLVRDLSEKETPDHISIVGPRYFGKSVLINALAERFSAEGSYYRVVLKWDLRHDTPEDDKTFQIALAKRLDKFLVDIGNLSFHDYLQDTQGDVAGTVSDVVESLAASGIRILILLDDFDRLASQPQISKNLWDYLRSLAQKEHLRFVLSSRRRLRECIPSRDGRTSDFWNIFTNVVSLKPFAENDIDDFLAPLVTEGYLIERSGKQEIVEWTGGIPVLVTCVCREIASDAKPSTIDKPMVDKRCRSVASQDWTMDAISQLWDDCGKDIQGDLLDIAEDSSAVGNVPPARQPLLQDRGYVLSVNGGFKASCRFMQRFAAGQDVRSRDLRDLFKNPETELRSLTSLLQLRLAGIAGGDPDTRSYIEHAIDGLARGPKTALASIRSIADEALNVAWETECPGNVMPVEMQRQLTMAWSAGGGDLKPDSFQKLNDKNMRRRMLRIASGDQGRKKVTQKVSRPMMLLIDYLYNLGNYGQHMNDIPPALESPVDVGFCISACWGSIELLKRMSVDLA